MDDIKSNELSNRAMVVRNKGDLKWTAAGIVVLRIYYNKREEDRIHM